MQIMSVFCCLAWGLRMTAAPTRAPDQAPLKPAPEAVNALLQSRSESGELRPRGQARRIEWCV